MTLATPVIYDLATDYARFGLTQAEAATLQRHRFENRHDFSTNTDGDESFIVLHIQDGTTVGSLRYWLGVQASSTVMIQRDGSILRIIPEQHGPWTNGDVNEPKPQAEELIAKPGNKNVWSLTIEAEGKPFVPMPQVQLDAIAWQCIDWMTRYPAITLDQILWHGWINSVTRANCGLYIEQVKQIIEREMAAPSPAPPKYATPLPVPFDLESDTGWHTLGKSEVFLGSWEVTALRNATPRAYAEDDAPDTGPKIHKDTTAEARGVFDTVVLTNGKERKVKWFLLPDRSRIRATAFTPDITVKPRKGASNG